MDAYDCVVTKRDIREYSSKMVPDEIAWKVLEAARQTGTGMNNQHWRFILVKDRENLKRLAQDSTTGRWVEGAAFAVVVLTNPKYGFHLIDAGRVAQNMGVAAWNYGIVSGVYTGFRADSMRRDFGVPEDLNPTIVVGFGYPQGKVTGRGKNRRPLQEVAFLEKFGAPVDSEKLSA